MLHCLYIMKLYKIWSEIIGSFPKCCINYSLIMQNFLNGSHWFSLIPLQVYRILHNAPLSFFKIHFFYFLSSILDQCTTIMLSSSIVVIKLNNNTYDRKNIINISKTNIIWSKFQWDVKNILFHWNKYNSTNANFL